MTAARVRRWASANYHVRSNSTGERGGSPRRPPSRRHTTSRRSNSSSTSPERKRSGFAAIAPEARWGVSANPWGGRPWRAGEAGAKEPEAPQAPDEARRLILAVAAGEPADRGRGPPPP